MDRQRSLVGKGFEPFGMKRREIFRGLAVQANKADHVPVDQYRRTNTGTQPICGWYSLPAGIQICVWYEFGLFALEHTLQVAGVCQRKPDSQDFSTREPVFIVTQRADHLGKVPIDQQDRTSIMRYNPPHRSQDMIENLSIVQGATECFSAVTQGFRQDA